MRIAFCGIRSWSPASPKARCEGNMNFENYLKLGKVKKKTPDTEEAKSLLEQAKDRLSYIKYKKITDKTAKFVLQDAYEAAREAAQSLMSREGYKPYSHEATIAFIKEYHCDAFPEEITSRFDHFRKLRNDSVYKAATITIEDADSCLKFSMDFVKKTQNM